MKVTTLLRYRIRYPYIGESCLDRLEGMKGMTFATFRISSDLVNLPNLSVGNLRTTEFSENNPKEVVENEC